MNRRKLMLGAAAVGVAAFAGGSWIVRDRRDREIAADAAARAAAVPDLNTLLLRPTAPVLGPQDAPVTLVEFFDPSCEACRAYHPVLKQLREQFPTQLRIVMRYAAFHEGSDQAVAMLEAARRQGVFEEVLDALLERQPEWALHNGPRMDLAWQIAEAAGLDATNREDEMKFPSTVAILSQDRADIEALGVRATPTFFLNGRQLNDMNLQRLAAAVQTEVAAAGSADVRG